jgi:alkaline phosphatase D
MNYIIYTLLFALPEISMAQSATPTLTAGPFVGSVTQTSAKAWIAYKGAGAYSVTLRDTIDHTIINPAATQKTGDVNGDTALILDYTGLKTAHTYRVVYNLAAKKAPDCIFTTQTNEAVRNLDFLVGSCALLNTDITLVAFPGGSARIFKPMTRSKADFMVWLGDNIYYLGRDYKSYTNMFVRNLKIREHYRILNNFLASKPQYSIWDDHDYGWNDSNKNFPLKDSSLITFRGFWPNTYETHETNFTFRYNDVELFMTDGRWFRDPPGDTAGQFLGAEQIKWLEAKLLHSDATFKFICIGSQVLNDNEHGETYANYPHERNALFNFIVDHNIKGVIFVTGDKHYSELSKREWRGYTLYDFTSSPITSPVITPRKILRKFDNPWSVKGTVIYQKNFGRVTVTGAPGSRVCKLAIYGKAGHLKWDYTIKAEELSRK